MKPEYFLKEAVFIVKNYALVYEKGKRKNNQDSLALQIVHTAKGEVGLAVVCDGIGGLELGEIASGYCIEKILEWFYQDFMELYRTGAGRRRLKISIRRKLYQIHNELRNFSRRKEIHIGTTVSGIVIYNHQYMIFHLGDCSIKRIKYRQIKDLTKRQTDELQRLYRCIGVGVFWPPEVHFGWIGRGDTFLLSSDGFGHYLYNSELLTLGQKFRFSAQKTLEELKKRAVKRGEQDNMSAVLLKF